MSAYLDKSQGITFVYSNIYSVYKKAKEAKLDSPFAVDSARVIKKAHASAQKVEEFEPRTLEAKEGERTLEVPMGVKEAEDKAKRLNARPIASLQKNLNELTDAHEKLRFLLQELESLTKKN